MLVTDARCYSATDIFAAGFADHAIGTILGVDDNTGAGGANVWTHGLLTQLLAAADPPDTDLAVQAAAQRRQHAGLDPADAAGRRAVRDAGGGPRRRPDAVHTLTRDDC